jgi:acetoin utilization protein AcuB
MRTIAHYMTAQPWSVQIDDSVGVARQMLATREIHHLPVLEGGRLVGMITNRALDTVPRDATVEQAMTAVHAVDASTLFGDALDEMLARRSDAIVITSAGRLEGIFTANDAVRLLRDRIRARPKRSGLAGSSGHGRSW